VEGQSPVSIDQLGRDLKAVIDAAVPQGPIVLVGHSMGGMTIMALAAHYPELIRERVVGVGLVGTSSGRLTPISTAARTAARPRRSGCPSPTTGRARCPTT
jgi:pimeloyl-ACP methyl ester carboxylesterase